MHPSLKPTNPSSIKFIVNKDYFNPKTSYNYDNILNYDYYYESNKPDLIEDPSVRSADIPAEKNNDKQIRDNLQIVKSNNVCSVRQLPPNVLLICWVAWVRILLRQNLV